MGMGLSNWTAGSVILKDTDKADSLLILLKGSVEITISEITITLAPGSILGLGVKPGDQYGSIYRAKTDASTYACPYSQEEGIESVFTDYAKLAPTMTSQAIKNAWKSYNALIELQENARAQYNNVMQKLAIYPDLCRKTGDAIKDYSALKMFAGPAEDTGIAGWRVNFIKSLISLESKKDELLTNRSGLSIGLTGMAVDFMRDVKDEISVTEDYKANLKSASAEFLMVFSALNSKKTAMASGGGEDLSSLTGLFDRILVYSHMSAEDAAEIKEAMADYKAIDDRYGVSDDIRKIRRRLSKAYYPLYEAVLMQSLKEKSIPVYVKMFLMFGLLDETLVTAEELQTLYGFASSYRPDPTGHVMCAYEWLYKIYAMEVEPSRNEFDMDYPAFLREQKNNGDITEEQMKKYLESPRRRLHFELNNMFTLGNRMTFGRISVFEPVFDDVNVTGSMERGYLHTDRINQELNEITDRDFSIFYRNDIYSNPDQNITQLPIHKEFRPDFILMPNMGSRFALWQEISGKKRQSRARVLVPIIMSEDIPAAMTKLCGEFRWEMCKTEQGVHWNDMRDPSLTAEYTDYLQFYKKNSMITADIKEKIKSELKKHNNNYKNVFVADYSDYIRFESNGSLRLLKNAREILAKYCPFSGKAKELLAENPQYKPYIERFNNHETKDRRIIALTIKRFEKDGIDVPQELRDEVTYLSH